MHLLHQQNVSQPNPKVHRKQHWRTSPPALHSCAKWHRGVGNVAERWCLGSGEGWSEACTEGIGSEMSLLPYPNTLPRQWSPAKGCQLNSWMISQYLTGIGYIQHRQGCLASLPVVRIGLWVLAKQLQLSRNFLQLSKDWLHPHFCCPTNCWIIRIKWLLSENRCW